MRQTRLTEFGFTGFGLRQTKLEEFGFTFE